MKISLGCLILAVWIGQLQALTMGQYFHTEEYPQSGLKRTSDNSSSRSAGSQKPKNIGTLKAQIETPQGVDVTKRADGDGTDTFACIAEILKNRLELIQDSVKRLLHEDRWKCKEGKPHVPHLKGYFEQLIFERWSTKMFSPDQEAGIDAIISNIFVDILPMYIVPGKKHPTPTSEPYHAIAIANFERSLNNFRIVILQILYTKNMHYRLVELSTMKTQLAKGVSFYRRACLCESANTKKVDYMIQAVFELLDWVTQEYTSHKEVGFTNVQRALAARIRERIFSINNTLSVIEVNNDSEMFTKVVPRAHELVFEYFALNFPTNHFTKELVHHFRETFHRLNAFEYIGPNKPTVMPFERIRAWCMRTKLVAAQEHLKSFVPVNALPPSAYWRLLQVKVDIRHWCKEIEAWEGSNIEEIGSLHLICDKIIKEVNRLKLSMDRVSPPESPESEPEQAGV
ncbi:hypothetical protein JCM33374_g4927 [Metschnikowia sp. JCM 33374]|nr:hypothetical protein JCM33374_g4927 [Metschnikowia sp. JCM 33374]